jgi:methylenetetrahydrofolate dehydrogenase (NADP+)/methenyltetrahydrofolate cyclohydrolase
MSAKAGRSSSGFVSKELVNSMVAFQQEHIAGLPRRPRLDVVLTGNFNTLPAYGANRSYAKRLDSHGRLIGANTRIHQPEERTSKETEIATLALIQALNENPNVDGIIPMLPATSREFSDSIRSAVSPRKDVDGVRGADSPFYPATPEAMARIAEDMLGVSLNDRTKVGGIAIVGNGAVVGKPLARLLESRGVPDVTVLGSRSDIEAGIPKLHSFARVVFSAIPKARAIHAENLGAGTVIIDAGNAIDPETKTAYGNVDPEIFADDRFQATAFHGGVGPVTAATIHQRTLNNASLALLGEPLPGEVSPFDESFPLAGSLLFAR